MSRKLAALCASVAVLCLLTLSPSGERSARPAQAQGACPSNVYVASDNEALELDSAVAVEGTGCSAGTRIDYYVDIPSNAYHPCNDQTGYPDYCWHRYLITTTNGYYDWAWVDLFRNESNPTKFPDGYYNFAACASQCIWSGWYYLFGDGSASGPAFNPWDPPGNLGSNMQWNRSLNPEAGPFYGLELGYVANYNNNADGDTLYQNLNGYFSDPNPNDPTGGFTQLVVEKFTSEYAPLFYEFTNDVDYCLNPYVPASVANPTFYCYLTGSPDNNVHWMWMSIQTNPAGCRDSRYACLQAFSDGTYFAEERMQNGGILTNPYTQSESYTSPDSSVWGAQLNYWDYSMSGRPGSLNQQVTANYSYAWQQYEYSPGYWAQFSWYDTTTSRRMENDVAVGVTYGGYCGPFAQAYYPDPGTFGDQSSAAWGSLDLGC